MPSRGGPINQPRPPPSVDGQLRYVLLGGRGDGPGGESSTDTTTWVKNTCTVVTGGTLNISDLYDCAR